MANQSTAKLPANDSNKDDTSEKSLVASLVGSLSSNGTNDFLSGDYDSDVEDKLLKSNKESVDEKDLPIRTT
jgi:hypothetical protein